VRLFHRQILYSSISTIQIPIETKGYGGHPDMARWVTHWGLDVASIDNRMCPQWISTSRSAGAIIGRYLSSTWARAHDRIVVMTVQNCEFCLTDKRVLPGKKARGEKLHYACYRCIVLFRGSTSAIVNAKREGENEGENVRKWCRLSPQGDNYLPFTLACRRDRVYQRDSSIFFALNCKKKKK